MLIMTKKSKDQISRILSGGSEPTFHGKTFLDEEAQTCEVEKAMNWYRQNFKLENSKKWVAEYLRSNNRLGDMANSSHASKMEIRFAAPYCRLLTRGLIPIGKYLETLNANISTLLQSVKKTALPVEDRVSVQDRIKCKANAMLADLEPVIDEQMDVILKGLKKSTPLIDWIKRTQWNKPLAIIVKERLEYSLVDLRLAYDKKESDLIEAYSFFTRVGLRKFIEELESAERELVIRISDLNANKKTRKKKIKSPEIQVKGLKFCAKNVEMGVDSLNPCGIIGTQALVVFNTRNKKATVFFAEDTKLGLGVKGSTIIGFSSAKSFEKTIRKPSEFLKTRINMASIMKYIQPLKTKSSIPTGRINKHCILLQQDRT